jgi:hypothetical protein
VCPPFHFTTKERSPQDKLQSLFPQIEDCFAAKNYATKAVKKPLLSIIKGRVPFWYQVL